MKFKVTTPHCCKIFRPKTLSLAPVGLWKAHVLRFSTSPVVLLQAKPKTFRSCPTSGWPKKRPKTDWSVSPRNLLQQWGTFGLLLFILCSAQQQASADLGDWRLGGLAGQVSLLGNVSTADPNGVAYGVSAGYFVEDHIALESMFLSSSHTNVNHTALSFGADYYLGDYITAYPSLSAGVSFLANKIKSAEITGDAFALYLGGGFDFEISEFLTAGIQARFQKAFEGKTRINGVDVTTVDDTFSVLLRFLYRFDGSTAEF